MVQKGLNGGGELTGAAMIYDGEDPNCLCEGQGGDPDALLHPLAGGCKLPAVVLREKPDEDVGVNRAHDV